MTRILSIETSTTVCSVAIHEQENCIDVHEISEQNAHSGKLTVLIEEILTKNSLQIKDFDAIAISKGPGSYTGLRIGTSVAKGLCFAANLPLIAVDTLQALALACKTQLTTIPTNTIFMPMIDARRMEVYTSQWNQNMDCIQETSALIVTEDTIHTFSPDTLYYIFGDGSEKCNPLLTATNITYIPHITATAQTIGTLAYQQFTKNDFADLAYFEPFYLKEFQTTVPKEKI